MNSSKHLERVEIYCAEEKKKRERDAEGEMQRERCRGRDAERERDAERTNKTGVNVLFFIINKYTSYLKRVLLSVYYKACIIKRVL